VKSTGAETVEVDVAAVEVGIAVRAAAGAGAAGEDACGWPRDEWGWWSGDQERTWTRDLSRSVPQRQRRWAWREVKCRVAGTTGAGTGAAEGPPQFEAGKCGE
jgi:hypothetical protein